MNQRLLLLLACFFVSGFAALLYQTAWTRELSFVFGTSDLAVAAVLAAYMGGLALGAAVAARVAHRLRRPVLVYGLLELGIAVSALLVPWGIRGINHIYVGLVGGAAQLPEAQSTVAHLFQLAAAFAVLLPPTAFMGATLPLLVRHAVRREDEIASRVGLLYSLNTVGAIAGTVCAAFLLMPELGLRRTVWIGASLNALVFLLAAALARRAPVPPQESSTAVAATPRGAFWILPAIALSGAVSFAYEVMWTRLLGHVLGASVQAFSTMLASFLLGIALGSALASRLAGSRRRAVLGFALAQLGIAATSYVAFALADWMPDLSARLGAGPGASLASAAVAASALLPVTICIGATFPFAVRVLTRDPSQAASATARVYSWNTVGAIVGSLGAGFLLLPALGFEGMLMVGVASSLLLAAVAALAGAPRHLGVAATAAAALLLLGLVPPSAPWKLLKSSPLNPIAGHADITYAAVGRTTTVLMLEREGRYQLTTGGLPEAWIDPIGFPPEINVVHWMAALPAFVRPGARELLVVGLGGGAALELLPASYERVDVIELESEVLEANRRVASLRQRDPLADPRVRIHVGDARGSLQLTTKRYDAIVSQPSHPWTAGASHLYTREFFELVKSRLGDDGVFVQWIGIHFIDEALLRSLLATLLEVFGHVELFRPQTHGLLFVASDTPIEALEGAQALIGSAPDEAARLGLHRLEDFASRWALDEAGVRDLAEGAQLITDDHNHLASRSARLGDDKLDATAARILLAAYDPLLTVLGDAADSGGVALDRGVLIREFALRARADRAMNLALAADGAEEEVGLGWIELSAGRNGRAQRHFTRALSLSPGHHGAMSGLLASRKFEVSQGTPIEGLSEVDFEGPYAALFAAWQASAEQDWEKLSALDGDLSLLKPGDPLFSEATRLRILWRLEAKTPAAGAEAQALAELLLVRVWAPYDDLLRARAAIEAERPRDAMGSLWRVTNRSKTNARGRVLIERALEIARKLPEEMALELREATLGRSEPPSATSGDSQLR